MRSAARIRKHGIGSYKGVKMVTRLFLLFLLPCILLHAAETRQDSQVSLQLQWLDQFQFAGYYMAYEKGFYKEAGLDVVIKPFRKGMCTTDEVLQGRADYGVGRSSLLIDRLKGKPVVALAAILQSSPNVLLARLDSGIRTIKDFKGKRIMLTQNAQESITYQAMLNAEGLSFDDMVHQEHSFDLQDLIDGRTDLMACYSSNEPYLMEQQKIPVIGFSPKEYGFDFYSDILFTSEAELRNHPQRVKAFLLASIKGWHYAFEHIDESVDLIHRRYNPQQKSREALHYEAVALKNLAFAQDLPLGHITIDKFNAIYDLYRVMGLTAEPWGRTEGFIYSSPLNAKVALTAREQEFLQEHTIVFGSTFFNAANGSHGYPLNAIAQQMWSKIAEENRIATRPEYFPTCREAWKAVRDRVADVTFYFDCSQASLGDVLFSKPYATFPNVIATRSNINYIPNLSSLEGRKVAVREDSNIVSQITKRYPAITLVPVPTMGDAMRLLKQQKVFAVIGILPLITNAITPDTRSEFKVSGTTPFTHHLHFMVRKDYPELLHIIDKTIDTLPLHERDMVLSQYAPGTSTEKIDYSIIFKIVLGALAVIAALIYRQYVLKRHNDALLEMAHTDKLTRLHNRLKLDHSLEELIANYWRYQRPFSLIMLDIDDFKKINDHFGHLAGDQALSSLADLLKRHLRATDILGRWGGEEFMIICRETEIEGAVALAEILQEVVSKEWIEGVGHITCSFGVTAVQEGDTHENLVKRVDDGMYQAKESGKNQVVRV